jgi:diguanylate cyclase (GGDEF)-like protein
MTTRQMKPVGPISLTPSPLWVYLGASAMLVPIGVLDVMTGWEWSVLPLYALPVVIATASTGLRGGLLLVLLATMTWWIAQRSSESNPWGTWELTQQALMRGATFTLVCVMTYWARESSRDRNESTRHDTLTGLVNRSGFLAEAAGLVSACRGGAVPVTFVLCDVRDLRGINARFGQSRGDLLLTLSGRALSAAVGASVGQRGCCGRIGADEFGALLTGLDEARARAWGDELMGRLRDAASLTGCGAQHRVVIIHADAPPLSLEDMIASGEDELSRARTRGEAGLSVARHSDTPRWVHERAMAGATGAGA